MVKPRHLHWLLIGCMLLVLAIEASSPAPPLIQSPTDETPTASTSSTIRPFRPPSNLYQTRPPPSPPVESRASHPIKSKTQHKNNLAQFIHVFTRNLVAYLYDIRNKLLPQNQNLIGPLLEKVHSKLLAYYTNAPEIINKISIADVVFWPTVDRIQHTILPNTATWIASLTNVAHGCGEWIAGQLSQVFSSCFSYLTNIFRGIFLWLPRRLSPPHQPAPRPDSAFYLSKVEVSRVEAPKAEEPSTTILVRILRFFGMFWFYNTIMRLFWVLFLVVGVAGVSLVCVAIGFAVYGVVRCWMLLWRVGRNIGALVIGGA